MLSLTKTKRTTPPRIDAYKAFTAEAASVDCGHELGYDGTYCVFCSARTIINRETEQQARQALNRMVERRAAHNVLLVDENNELRANNQQLSQQITDLRVELHHAETRQAAAERHPIENALHSSMHFELTTKQLADMLDKSTSWISNEGRRLKERGLITVGKKGTSNVYSLVQAALPGELAAVDREPPRPPSLLDPVGS